MSAADQPVSIAAVLVELDAKGFGEPIAEWHGLACPTVPMNPHAQRVHGMSVEALRGLAFDVPALTSMLDRASALIAHNARFDIRMIGQVISGIERRRWRCTQRQWPWAPLANKKLDTVCAHFAIERSDVHGALADAHALRQALMQRTGKTDRSRTYLYKLLQRGDFAVETPRRSHWSERVDGHAESRPPHPRDAPMIPHWVYWVIGLLLAAHFMRP
ncbi:3'-5' exonuclease [Lysobacter ciconiae]|uniref:3'-5' exonuclease n=1 Tax=Novilysobacter ciconiae TaxID=2781022 RepID=A0A7S6ZSI9_9GAMM|nr:3'-5' exonuclease [Lysobacter ciconiae]QOW19865.1 3'-5' exonuclease [Lysobacter ciconiae]